MHMRKQQPPYVGNGAKWIFLLTSAARPRVGMNYLLLCKGEFTEDYATDNIIIITIYEDLDGNAEISNIHVLDLLEFI